MSLGSSLPNTSYTWFDFQHNADSSRPIHVPEVENIFMEGVRNLS